MRDGEGEKKGGGGYGGGGRGRLYTYHSTFTTTMSPALARVSGQVVKVVVVVRELFFLVKSAICVRIRGRRSEVTKTVYHMTQVFCLLLRSHHSEFVGTI